MKTITVDKKILTIGAILISLIFILNFTLAQATDTFLQISLLVAFLGGIIAILSPCSLAIIPAFFAYALESKKELVKMTFLFFLGLSLVLVPLGFAASAVGQFLTLYRVQIAFFAGIIMILFGVAALFDMGIPFFGSLFTKTPKTKNRYFNNFLFGALFGVGFSPCSGPILGGILTLAATTGTALAGGFMLLIYVFGMVVPLFLLSYFFEKIQFHKSRWVHAGFDLNVFGYKHRFHWTKVVSGLLFIAFGLAFIKFGGTSFLINIGARLNLLDPFFNAQDLVLKYFSEIPNQITILVLLAIVGFIGYRFFRRKRKR